MYGMYVVMIVALEVCFDIGVIWVFPTNLQIEYHFKKTASRTEFFRGFFGILLTSLVSTCMLKRC